MSDACKGCRASVHLPPAEIQRLIDALAAQGATLVEPATAEARLRICASCASLDFGTTCRHCGCLAPVRARLAGKSCPHPDGAKW